MQYTSLPIYEEFHQRPNFQTFPWSVKMNFQTPVFLYIDIYIFQLYEYPYNKRESKTLFRLPFGSHGIPWKRLKIGLLRPPVLRVSFSCVSPVLSVQVHQLISCGAKVSAAGDKIQIPRYCLYQNITEYTEYQEGKARKKIHAWAHLGRYLKRLQHEIGLVSVFFQEQILHTPPPPYNFFEFSRDFTQIQANSVSLFLLYYTENGYLLH